MAFDKCEHLENLTLAINPNFKASQELENLTCFEHALNLKRLNLNGFKIKLTRQIVCLEHLTHLNLDSCGIKQLPSNLFSHVLNLDELSFKGNHLCDLSGGIFENLTKLRALNLSYNQLVILNGRMFNGLSCVESIDFSYNFLSDINENSFWAMRKLKRLNFHRNFLKSLHLNTFKCQCDLEELILSFNKFTRMEDMFFMHLKSNSKSLYMLKLDMNRFIEWSIKPEFFHGYDNLKALYLGETIFSSSKLPNNTRCSRLNG